MFWRAVLGYTALILAGGAGFLLASLIRFPAGILLLAGLVMAVFCPPHLTLGFLLGAWPGMAASVAGKSSQESFGLGERLTWQRILQDAAAVDFLLFSVLVYAYRARAHASSWWVLATTFLLLLTMLFCYFYSAGRKVPKRLRAVHGYLVGFFSFLPWAYPLARWHWAAFGLGLVSFLVLPAFSLSLWELNLRSRLRRPPRRMGRRMLKKKFRIGRRPLRPAGLGRP